jgi:hypothetical protein
MTIDPVTAVVRPTAVLDWPKSVSLIRYPACDPDPIFQVPSSATGAPDGTVVIDPPDPAVDPEVVVGELDRVNGAGALPSMKWM